jgi:uncharacterized Fe-S center protein
MVKHSPSKKTIADGELPSLQHLVNIQKNHLAEVPCLPAGSQAGRVNAILLITHFSNFTANGRACRRVRIAKGKNAKV